MLFPTTPLLIKFNDFQFLLTGHHGGSVPQTPYTFLEKAQGNFESSPPPSLPNLDLLRKVSHLFRLS